MRDAKDRAARLIGQAFDLPAVRENDLADDGEAEAGPLLVRGEVRLENLETMFGAHAGAAIGNVEHDFPVGCARGIDRDALSLFRGLKRVEKEIEEHLTEQL